MRKTILLFCFILKYAFCSTIRENADDLVKKNSGFLFSMPKLVITGKNTSVCISLHEATVPAKALIDLKWKEKHFPTMRHLEAEHSCFEIFVPHIEIKEPHYVSVRVQIQINGVIHSSHNHDPILLYPYKLSKTFISTDKGIYKPGDKVRFRILTIDEQLLPQNSKIPDVKIKNPLDVTVAAWENVTPENGLVTLEYKMVSESLTGKWKIESQGETRVFEVFKYVLPRFKIDLLYPKLLYYKTNSLNITVCGQYAYGRYVNGLAFVKVSDSHNNMLAVHKLKELQNGCAEFGISSEELSLYQFKEKFPMYDPKMFIHITATVTEKGTGKIDVTTGKSLIFLKPYSMKFINNPIFQPGLPYRGMLKLSNINVNLTNELIEVCYNLAIKKSWNYLNNEQCSNFTLQSDNTVEFFVLPVKSNVIHMHINARSLNHTEVGDSFLTVRLYSSTGSYISLQQTMLEKTNEECRAPQQFTVTYTTDKFNDNDTIIFYYMIKSRNHIYKMRKIHHNVKKTSSNHLYDPNRLVGGKHKFTKPGSAVDEFIIKFKLDRRIAIKYQLLVYYVTSSGETVAATKNIDVEPCLLKVEAKWQQKKVVPGDTATLNIKTGVHALCSISAIDKSTTFFPNYQQKLDAKSLFKSFPEEKDMPVSGRKTCVPPTKKHIQAALSLDPDNFTMGFNMWDLRRRKRYAYPFSEDYDSYDIFNNFGTITITNLKLVTKHCYTGPLLRDDNPVQFLTDQYEDHNEEKHVTVRSYFPETWLWEIIPVRDKVQLKRHLPHSITNWVTNVLCTSDEEGLGFSQETEISSFQSFFVEVLTPYSIKRDEDFYLNIHITSYLNYKFPIRITLRLSDGLKVKNADEKLTLSYCLLENSTITHLFPVRATIIGTVNVTVLAESDNEYPEHCGPETILSKRDIVLKTILVESEGYPVKITKSSLLCASETHPSNNISWDISLPNEIISGTDKARITLNGDLVGHTIENLEELLDVPTGCGEQIMATMAPNLYVLRYLNATNSLKNSIRHRIIRNLKIGYQRILNYVHKDGSFSAFGYHDPAGSMFLTAFVVRTLQEARQHIYVDQRIIDKAVLWIYEHQLENGCFNTMLHVFQDMGGTSKENSTASLTAYVIVSLMEANIEVPKAVQTNAKYCIRSQYNPDKYTLAISCYALHKVKWYSEADRLMNRLLSISNQQQNMLWWNSKEKYHSATDIEITSYVLLSLLHHSTTENLANAHSIVRWLSSQYGPNGGFKSTQDTVVALDALTKYSKLVTTKHLNLAITVESKEQKQELTLTYEDRLKSKIIHLKDSNNNIKIIVNGDGCVLAQVTQSYYLKHVPKSEAFKLAVDIAPVSTIDQCSIKSLSPCLAYTGPDGPANMAVMEVTLPSGYEADRASLYKLVETENTSKVKMFEELNNKVNIYFTKLDKQLVCFSFNIHESSVVLSRKDSVVKLYDYYRPEYEKLQIFRVNNDCLFNDSTQLPEVVVVKPLSTQIKLDNVTIELQENSEETTEEEIYPSEEENIVKRSIDNVNFTSKGNEEGIESGANMGFKDKNVEPEFSNCDGNVPYYTVTDPSPIKREKRGTDEIKPDPKNIMADNANTESSNGATLNGKKTNLNEQFVEKNVDIEFSNCDGNVPYYTVEDTPNNQNKADEVQQLVTTLGFGKNVNDESSASEDQKHHKETLTKKTQPNSDALKHELNPKFVDMDIEMDMPTGMEGNRPSYIKPSPDVLKNMTSSN